MASKRSLSQLSKQKNKQLMGVFATFAAVILAGLVWASFDQPSASDMDLSQIGQGENVIVQVHDHRCKYCRALKENVDAVRPEYEGKIRFLVADISTDDGRSFAQYHEVDKVTLVFFDKKGKRISTLNGVQEQDFLRRAFDRTYNLETASN